MTLEDFLEDYGFIGVDGFISAMRIVGLSGGEFHEELSRLMKAGVVEKRAYGSHGMKVWGIRERPMEVEKVVGVGKDLGEFTVGQLAYRSEVGVREVEKIVEKLVESGRIARVGSKKIRGERVQVWTVVDSRGAESVRDLLSKGPLPKKEIAARLGLSKYRVEKILDELEGVVRFTPQGVRLND